MLEELDIINVLVNQKLSFLEKQTKQTKPKITKEIKMLQSNQHNL